METAVTILASPPRSRPWLTLLLILLLVGIYIAAMQIVLAIFFAVDLQRNPNLDVEGWLEGAQSNGNVASICTIAATLVTVPLTLLAARWVSRGAAKELLGLKAPTMRSTVVWLLGVSAFTAVIDGFTRLIGGEVVTPSMLDLYSTANPRILIWLTLAVAASINEELLFRGLLYGGLSRSAIRPLGAAVVSALAWSCLHIQHDLWGIGSIFLGGLLLAAARYATRSTVMCMVLHSAFNIIAIIEVIVALQWSKLVLH
jgi:membrane protease YdiL (CAAX protease family)